MKIENLLQTFFLSLSIKLLDDKLTIYSGLFSSV